MHNLGTRIIVKFIPVINVNNKIRSKLYNMLIREYLKYGNMIRSHRKWISMEDNAPITWKKKRFAS